jgi:hypothetical protein
VAISEMAKLALTSYMSYLSQQGLDEAQIDALFQKAKTNVFAKDPSQIPD